MSELFINGVPYEAWQQQQIDNSKDEELEEFETAKGKVRRNVVTKEHRLYVPSNSGHTYVKYR